MSTSVWRLEDGVLLQQLRQSAKIDDFVFAHMNAISLAQLRELEGRGEGSFYNPQIKTNTGQKLLRKLGHESAMPVPGYAQTTATAAQPLSTAPERMPFRASGTIGVHPKWAAALVLIGGLVWTGSRMPWPDLAQRLSAPEVKTPPLSQAAPATQPSAAQDTVLATFADPPPQTTAAPAPPTASTAVTDGRTGASCDWRHHPGSAAYEPTDPIKAGNYIHFVAAQDVNVCVRDQKNQLTDLQLKAGAAQSVYGEPPFLVHSPSWQNLQVFFQGRRVIGTPDGAAYWLFKSKEL